MRWDSHWAYGAVPTQGWHKYGVLNSGTWANADRGGPPDHDTRFPNAFEVDYVRVYRDN